MNRFEFTRAIQIWDLDRLVRTHRLCVEQIKIDTERDKAFIIEMELVRRAYEQVGLSQVDRVPGSKLECDR